MFSILLFYGRIWGICKIRTSTKHQTHLSPQAWFEFWKTPFQPVFLFGRAHKKKRLQAKKFAKKTQQQLLLRLLGFSWSFRFSFRFSFRCCSGQAFARGISEETSVSMRLREALGTLEAWQRERATKSLSFRLGGMLGDLFEGAWQKENDLITSFTIFSYQRIHCLAGGFSFISLALFTGELKG